MPKSSPLRNEILSLLRVRPDITRKAIKGRLGPAVTYQAVQKQLRRLERKGEVKPGFIVVDKDRAKRSRFWVFIETKHPHEGQGAGVAPRSTALRGDAPSVSDWSLVAKHKGYQLDLCQTIYDEIAKGESSADLIFEDMQILLGADWDILLCVSATSADHVGTFVTCYLRTLDCVASTKTAQGLTTPIDVGTAGATDDSGGATIATSPRRGGWNRNQGR